MRKRVIILLLVFVAPVLILRWIGEVASKPPPIHVGLKVNDPVTYFKAYVDAQNQGIFIELAGRFINKRLAWRSNDVIYATLFGVRPGHEIASRRFIYLFDTNGMCISIKSDWHYFGDF